VTRPAVRVTIATAVARILEAPFAMPNCLPFLERLSPPVRAQVIVNARRVRYPAASVPWLRGDPMQSAILVSGLARVFISSAAGRQATVRYVHAGELMGGVMMADEPFPASVQIVAEGVVQYLDHGLFKALINGNQEVSLAVANELGARYVHTVQSASVLVFGTTVQKVAYDLLERACREQLATGRLVVGVTHQELADSVNSSREVVSRAVGALRRQAIIGSTVRRITILEPAQLEKTAWHG
jgi:CRP/FNR family transcriptional regulator, cyclic AMP receptor protein